MSSELLPFVDTNVLILTNDGKIIVGTLKGYDQTTNVILKDAHERMFSTDEPVSFVPLGLYIIRGDNIAVIGSLNEDLDASIDYKHALADPIPPIYH